MADPAEVACHARFILHGRSYLFGFHGDTLQVFGRLTAVFSVVNAREEVPQNPFRPNFQTTFCCIQSDSNVPAAHSLYFV